MVTLSTISNTVHTLVPITPSDEYLQQGNSMCRKRIIKLNTLFHRTRDLLTSAKYQIADIRALVQNKALSSRQLRANPHYPAIAIRHAASKVSKTILPHRASHSQLLTSSRLREMNIINLKNTRQTDLQHLRILDVSCASLASTNRITKSSR